MNKAAVVRMKERVTSNIVMGLVLVVASLSGLSCSTLQTKKETSMNVRNVFTLITTDKLYECRDFYIKHFGFSVAFQTSIFIQLTIPSENGGSYDVTLMPPDHPFGENFRGAFNGTGAYLTIEVADAAAVYERLKAGGAPIVADLKDEVWGQRHFLTRDPGGMTVDIIEFIEPVPGYYDQYQVKE